jgi:hypothetical protein
MTRGSILAIAPRIIPEAWPAALRLDQAAQYSGLSVETFKAICPVKPVQFTTSSRGNRYLRVRLDQWLLSLDPNQESIQPIRRLGERLHGGQSAPQGA